MEKLALIKYLDQGLKGTGTVAIKNYDAWQKLEVKMDTIASNNEIDTSFELFGKTFKYPVFAGPVGAVSQHYSDLYNDNSFNEVYVNACAKVELRLLLEMV